MKNFAWQHQPKEQIAHYFIRNPAISQQVMAMCGAQVNTKDAIFTPNKRHCENCLDVLAEEQ